jgi:hypothetical protein
MTTWLKQSAAADVELGPFVDDTDFKTAETALTINQADCQLIKNGGSPAQKNDSTAATHLGGGHYKVPLNAIDTGTLGRLRVYVNESGALPVWRDFIVVPAAVYDSLIAGTDNLTADLTSTAVDDIWDEAKSGHAVAGSFGEEIQSHTTSADIPTANAIADQVWDELLSGHTSVGSAGEALAGTGSVGDPWTTALPGSYTSGQAGYIVGSYLDQAISSMNESPGSGAFEFTYTLTSSVDSSPIEDADVWVTSDSAGSVVVASGRTDAAGEVTFYLDAGTYYVWRQKAGWNFTNPDMEEIG